MTACPMAWAQWLLPLPGGPRNRASSRFPTQFAVASSKTRLRFIRALNWKSKLSRRLSASRNCACLWRLSRSRLLRQASSSETSVEIAAHEAILRNAQFQGRRASIVRSRAAIVLDQLENALDATHSEFALASMDGVADSADAGSCLVCTSQQLKQLRWRATRAIRIPDAVPATFAAQMLAQQLAGAGIEQTHEHRVPLHMHLTPDPARRRSIVSSFNLDTTI